MLQSNIFCVLVRLKEMISTLVASSWWNYFRRRTRGFCQR